MKNQLSLLRAHGRCTGAQIFSLFGACWLLTSCAFSHRFHLLLTIPICLTGLLLAAAAWQTARTNPAPVLDATLDRRKKADDRSFGIINAITYTAVFLLFLLFPRLGLQNFIFPSFVALVGLHFLPMPPLYQHTANRVTGVFMVLWAIFCAIAWRADGNQMAAFVTLGAGIALWISSVSAILTAKRLFQTRSTETAPLKV